MLEDKVAFINMATSYQVSMGYKESWIYVVFKNRYGAWPGVLFKQRVPSDPSSEFLEWIKAQQEESIKAKNETDGKNLILVEQAKLNALRKLIHPRKGRTANQLAQTFGVTARTVQRYTSVPRAEYEANGISRAKPWEALGMSRATWYRKGKPLQAPANPELEEVK